MHTGIHWPGVANGQITARRFLRDKFVSGVASVPQVVAALQPVRPPRCRLLLLQLQGLVDSYATRALFYPYLLARFPLKTAGSVIAHYKALSEGLGRRIFNGWHLSAVAANRDGDKLAYT